jgi:hypothetical protein
MKVCQRGHWLLSNIKEHAGSLIRSLSRWEILLDCLMLADGLDAVVIEANLSAGETTGGL